MRSALSKMASNWLTPYANLALERSLHATPACVPQLLVLPLQTPAMHASHPQPVALWACQTAHELGSFAAEALLWEAPFGCREYATE